MNTENKALGTSLGVIALIASLVVPIWLIVGSIFDGPLDLTGIAWLVVILIDVSPYNVIFFGLVLIGLVLGTWAVVRGGKGRVFGVIALVLTSVQVLALIITRVVFNWL